MKKDSGRTPRPRNPRGEFANQLFENAAARAEEIDPIISSHAQNWRIERISAIDRAILRLALAELRTTGTPAKVVINEAVELAKKFSSEEAAAFINGILDAAVKSFGENRRLTRTGFSLSVLVRSHASSDASKSIEATTALLCGPRRYRLRKKGFSCHSEARFSPKNLSVNCT